MMGEEIVDRSAMVVLRDGGCMQPGVRQALAALYRICARYPLNPDMSYCRHCVDEDEVRVLQVVPLQDLSAGQLRRLAWKAGGTWGDERDWLHFAPRILELFALGAFDDPTLLDKTLSRLKAAAAGWRAEDRAAVEAYRFALWRDFLAGWPTAMAADDMVEALSGFDEDLQPYLDIWSATPSTTAARHLASFVAYYVVPVCDELGRVEAWMAGDAPLRLLDTARAATAEANILAELDAAIVRIRDYQAWLERR
ncbi:hypothetical protein ACQP2P_26440 [Dactylosporangium sp. CA-139114]|uniref:hypothetical protein n=1 Tax=Dactylosporangium sp. CA-139114 TaxID=3239931 RepID=UPI003D96372C